MQIQAGDDIYQGRAIKQDFLPDLSDWHEEGLGHFSPADGRMLIDAREGGYSAFYREELPRDIVVRYSVRSLPPYRQNNFNLISHCRPPNRGWPIVEQGKYPGYRAFENYIVTFVGDWEQDAWGQANRQGRVRFRRNPGFAMNLEREVESAYGAEYEIVYAARNGLIRYYIDGAKVGEWQDPAPLAGGFLALRTFCTTAEYWDFAIAELDLEQAGDR